MSEVGGEEMESDEDVGEAAEELDGRTTGELTTALRRSQELEVQLAAVKAEQAAERMAMAAMAAKYAALKAKCSFY